MSAAEATSTDHHPGVSRRTLPKQERRPAAVPGSDPAAEATKPSKARRPID